MRHLGDITKISGYDIPVVDVITGGSPCQDLSVAGKRAGLDGERSGLFMEQIRIVKEMRERDRRTGRSAWLIRPRFMVWENVPGAFSSNKGRDFQAVLTEIVKIAEPGAPDVPMSEGGRWSNAGCLYSDVGAWSVAWRVHDAQFWGVPQRRKRIALVADFGGLTAPEILFERKGMSRDSEPCGEAWEGVAEATGGGVDSTGWGWHNGTYYMDADIEADPTIRQPGDCIDSTYPTVARSLTQRYNGSPCIDRGPDVVVQNINVVTSSGTDVADTLDSSYYKGTGSRNGKERTVVCIGNGQLNQMSMTEQANTLDTMHDQQAVMVLPFDTTQVTSDKNWSNPHYGDPCHPLAAQAHVPSIASPSIVRRLTPLECERLQGYPDGWTDIGEWTDTKGKKHKEADSPRYKALGNSIALPFWEYLARRICAQYERPVTMGSLFDGIGGFPLAFERAGAKAVWASEIEEFPIAVTKKRFPEPEDKK